LCLPVIAKWRLFINQYNNEAIEQPQRNTSKKFHFLLLAGTASVGIFLSSTTYRKLCTPPGLAGEEKGGGKDIKKNNIYKFVSAHRAGNNWSWEE